MPPFSVGADGLGFELGDPRSTNRCLSCASLLLFPYLNDAVAAVLALLDAPPVLKFDHHCPVCVLSTSGRAGAVAAIAV